MADLSLFDLTGRTALITGGNTGIGLGMARGLARAGARVVITGRDASKNERALEELRAINSQCQAFVIDLENTDAIAPFFDRVVAETGGIDALFNNAGIQYRRRADQIEPAEWERVQRVNVTAPFLLSQRMARERIASGRPGSIVMVGSVMSEGARPTIAAYTTSKGAIRQMVRALAVDWAPMGIRVNGIGPGYIETEMTRPLSRNAEFDAWVRKRTPLGRWGTPADLEGAAVFLASDAARFITGQILYVDGGWLATF